MNNKSIQLFDFNDNLVRTILNENNEIFFVANDVCKILEISNPRQAVARLDEDERVSFKMTSFGGEQEMTAITESGLYSLVLGSRKK